MAQGTLKSINVYEQSVLRAVWYKDSLNDYVVGFNVIIERNNSISAPACGVATLPKTPKPHI